MPHNGFRRSRVSGRTLIVLLVILATAFFVVQACQATASADTTTGLTASETPDTTSRDSLASARDSLEAWSSTAQIPSFDFSGENRESSGGWVWFISSILIVIGLLYLSLYLLKRFFYRPSSSLAASGQFELIQQFHLGPKRNLTLIRVCGRILLLGVTDNSINTLMEISDEEELKGLLDGLKAGPGVKSQNFREIYQGLVGRLKS